MKQKIQLLFFICISFLFAGCNQEDFGDIDGAGITDEYPMPVNLSFTNEEISTRMIESGDYFNLGDTIGLYMFDNTKSLSRESILEGGDNVIYHYYRFPRGFQQLEGAPRLYYPADKQQKVNFIAYFPYSSSVTNYIYPIRVLRHTDREYKNHNIILYSNTTKDASANRDTTRLYLRHVMSRVEFRLYSGEGGPAISDVKAKITGLYSSASLNLVNGEISDLRSAVDFDLVTETGYPPKARIYLIPQTLSDSKLIITLGQEEFEYAFPAGVEFRSGENHIYTMTINKTGIVLTDNTITDWDGKDEAPIEKTVRKYEVGDYYPDPADASTAIGMVFEITDGTGYHGKIVDFIAQKQYNRWGDIEVDEQTAGVTNIRDVNDGSMGTKNLISKRKDQQPDFSDKYKVFHWIYETKNGRDVNGMWYLPARDELRKIGTVLSDWQQKAEEAGYARPPSTFYVSSTEISTSHYIRVQLNDIQYGDTQKDDELYYNVVAVAKF